MTAPAKSFIRSAPLPPAEDSPTTVDRLTDLMTCGATGSGQLALLRWHFPGVTREEMFNAVAQATALYEIDRLGLANDLTVSEATIVGLREALAGSQATVASLQAALAATAEPTPQRPAVTP